MVKKRTKTKARRSRRTSKRKPKSILTRLAKYGLAVVFLGFAGLSLYFLMQNKTWRRQGLSKDMLEGIMLAADVQTDTDVVRRTRDDGERWLIHISSTTKRDGILGAINKVLASQGKRYKTVDKRKRGQENYQLVEVPLDDGTNLRLIFQVTEPKPVAANIRADVATNLVDRSYDTLTDAGEGKPKVVIILDDVGHKPVEHLRPILDLRYPITFAILPYLKYSQANAIYLHQNHYEVILHLPMEPDNYPRNNPGKGAILANLNDGEIRLAVDRALKNIPFVDGVNNHMGSKITANRTLMRSVLSELKKRNLFFIDSRTHKNSIAFDLSRAMGLSTAKRDIFLDAEESYEFSVKQLQLARKVAKDQGLAIVIGHPYPSTLEALVDEMPKLEAEGFRFEFASEVVQDYSENL